MLAVLIAFSALAMVGAYVRTGALVQEFAIDGARSLADLVAATTSWTVEHGGAWAPAGPSSVMSPFLAGTGVSAEATTTDGRVFVLNSHGEVAKDLSEEMARAGGAAFRLVSLQPMDPGNSPDAWERTALIALGGGSPEEWSQTTSGTTPVFRYMRPLRVESGCLPCHGAQGYRIGEVKGAVSVIVPLDNLTKDQEVNVGFIAGGGVLFALGLAALASGFVWRLQRQVRDAQSALVEAATVDELTGTWSRRHTMERLGIEIERAERSGEPLALIMADIDRFKVVNDTYGHAAGDTVLAQVTRRIGQTMRPYDILGRIGGEEFLLIAPGADPDAALALAERARLAVSSSPISTDRGAVNASVSMGVTVVVPGEPSALDRALGRADAALYASKEGGRGRTSVQSPG
jgi:diguanylate cyclase (GGDEF)-like protein